MTDHIRDVLLAMRNIIDSGETSLARTLDKANCPYAMRDAVTRRLATSADAINAVGGNATASAVIRRALAVTEVQMRIWNAKRRLSELRTFEV